MLSSVHSDLGQLDRAKLLQGESPDMQIIDTSDYYPFCYGSIADVQEGKPESV